MLFNTKQILKRKRILLYIQILNWPISFTLPIRDKDENQEIESIEASLREGNALTQ